MGEGDEELQTGDEDVEKPTEVVESTCRTETQEKDVMLESVQSMWVDDQIPGDWRVLWAGHSVATPHSQNPGEGGG